MAEEKAFNTLSDIRYKLMLRYIAELELTQSTQAPDNPRGLSAAEVTAFAEYRKKWHDIAHGDLEGIRINEFAEMMLQGVDFPPFPDGWRVTTRSVGDLPPILVKESDLDVYDATLERDEGDFEFTIRDLRSDGATDNV